MTTQKTHFFDSDTRPKIIVAPLNWGLGHATRCMPIIQALLDRNTEVILASDGRALALLRQEYPQFRSFQLPAYDIQYSGNSFGLVPAMLLQIPKILQAIRAEKKAIDQIVKKERITAIISDNRYGCYHPTIPSIFISHQLFLKMPSFLQWIEPIVAQTQMRFIQHFRQCWIPDFPSPLQNLSGDLAHKKPLNPDKFHFIGTLSRMKKSLPPMTTNTSPVQHFLKEKYDVVAILSGPEPQRTLFEEMLQKQFLQSSSETSPKFRGKQGQALQCLIIRGITEQQNLQSINPQLQIINFLTATDLNRVLLTADTVIARAGYSTLMDLAALGKQKAILIPTPGQTEQIYLANHFHAKGIYYSTLQSELNLNQALEEVEKCSGLQTSNEGLLEEAIEGFVDIALNRKI